MYTITGTFTLASGVEGSSTDCHGTGGYDDIRANLAVIVRSGDGEIIATGSLGKGVFPPGAGHTCAFPMTIAVPKSDFYSIEVGHRGELTYSFDDMVARGWTVALTIGQ